MLAAKSTGKNFRAGKRICWSDPLPPGMIKQGKFTIPITDRARKKAGLITS
jgi:hypothetical protein